jgi:hypothetical protein
MGSGQFPVFFPFSGLADLAGLVDSAIVSDGVIWEHAKPRQLPPVQVLPGGHTLPHPPQFNESVRKSVHRLPQ